MSRFVPARERSVQDQKYYKDSLHSLYRAAAPDAPGFQGCAKFKITRLEVFNNTSSAYTCAISQIVFLYLFSSGYRATITCLVKK